MIQVTRFDEAKTHDAKGHYGMTAMQIQIINRANQVVQMLVVSP